VASGGRQGWPDARAVGALHLGGDERPGRGSRDRRRRDEGAPLLFSPRVRDEPAATYERASDEHGRFAISVATNRRGLGAKIRLIPGHCDPAVNLYDWCVARGHSPPPRGDRPIGALLIRSSSRVADRGEHPTEATREMALRWTYRWELHDLLNLCGLAVEAEYSDVLGSCAGLWQGINPGRARCVTLPNVSPGHCGHLRRRLYCARCRSVMVLVADV
jgi:hypothetical protein